MTTLLKVLMVLCQLMAIEMIIQANSGLAAHKYLDAAASFWLAGYSLYWIMSYTVKGIEGTKDEIEKLQRK